MLAPRARHLEALRRRLTYLTDQLPHRAEPAASRAYMEAEASALRWAIAELEHVVHATTPARKLLWLLIKQAGGTARFRRVDILIPENATLETWEDYGAHELVVRANGSLEQEVSR